jgi:ATP synthase F1 delta subunit
MRLGRAARARARAHAAHTLKANRSLRARLTTAHLALTRARGPPACSQVATVTSAQKLENEQQFAIAKKLQEMTGAKNIKLKPVVDPSLIGGFVVQFGKDGSGMIDLSIKGQMQQLAAQLTAA